MNFKMKLGWNRPENLLVICVKLENVSVCSYSVNSVSLVGDYYVLVSICCLRGHLFLALYKWDKYSHFEVSWWLLMNKFCFVWLCYAMEFRFWHQFKIKMKVFWRFYGILFQKSYVMFFMCAVKPFSISGKFKNACLLGKSISASIRAAALIVTMFRRVAWTNIQYIHYWCPTMWSSNIVELLWISLPKIVVLVNCVCLRTCRKLERSRWKHIKSSGLWLTHHLRNLLHEINSQIPDPPMKVYSVGHLNGSLSGPLMPQITAIHYKRAVHAAAVASKCCTCSCWLLLQSCYVSCYQGIIAMVVVGCGLRWLCWHLKNGLVQSAVTWIKILPMSPETATSRPLSRCRFWLANPLEFRIEEHTVRIIQGSHRSELHAVTESHCMAYNSQKWIQSCDAKYFNYALLGESVLWHPGFNIHVTHDKLF